MIKEMSRWINRVARLGTSGEYYNDISSRIVFSNIIFISLPVVYFIFMVIDYRSYLVTITDLHFDQLTVPIIILVCFICFYLNSKRYTVVSRVLFIILWPILLHILPIQLLKTPNDYYLAYPFGLVFHAVLIQLMFSYKNEWVTFGLLMILNLVAVVFSPETLIFFDDDKDLPNGMISFKYYILDIVLYWLLFNLVTFYILYVIERFIYRLNNSRKLIENQKQELNKLNKNLEGTITERTRELEEQNEKLKQYAFFNAHLLRGPFCRIQGLLILQEIMETQDQDQQLIREKLKESIDELDNRIKEIQKLVDRH